MIKNAFRHLLFHAKKLRTMFLSHKIWVLSKNGVRIAVRRLIKVLETTFCDNQENWVLSKHDHL